MTRRRTQHILTITSFLWTSYTWDFAHLVLDCSPSAALSPTGHRLVEVFNTFFLLYKLDISAMTGKLADRVPTTMSSLINTISDNLYPEEASPSSSNIFTSTDSISPYSQMNTGKDEPCRRGSIVWRHAARGGLHWFAVTVPSAAMSTVALERAYMHSSLGHLLAQHLRYACT